MSSNSYEDQDQRSLNARIASLFVERQDAAVRVLLQSARVSYDPGVRVITIRFNGDLPSEAVMLKKAWTRGKAIILPELVSPISIRIETDLYSEVIIGGMAINQDANPLGAIDAVARIMEMEGQGVRASIAFFTTVKEDKISLMMTNALREFTGYELNALYNDDSVALFDTDEAQQSLDRLQSQLETVGYVEDFTLVSRRTNGVYGLYTIDAWYVDWNGVPARLTVYKNFSPVPSPRH